VSRTSKTLAALKQIIRNPWLLNKVLDNEMYWKKYAQKTVAAPDHFPLVMPWELFGDFKETIFPFTYLDGGSLPTDLAL
jgi:hypothetical protein